MVHSTLVPAVHKHAAKLAKMKNTNLALLTGQKLAWLFSIYWALKQSETECFKASRACSLHQDGKTHPFHTFVSCGRKTQRFDKRRPPKESYQTALSALFVRGFAILRGNSTVVLT